MKKYRYFIVLLAVLLILPLCFTGCKTKAAVHAKIGVLRGDASSEEALSWERYLRTLSDRMGVEIDFSKALESADDELAAVQNYASLGYTGIIVMTSYNPTNLLKKCQDYGMYMVVAAAHPDFEASANALVKDESVQITDYSDYTYYVGATGPSNYGEVLAGYQMGKAGVEQGYTKYTVFTGSAAYGQPMHALRIAGFMCAMHDDDPSVTYHGVACTMENWQTLTKHIEKDLGIDLSAFSSDKYQILAQTGGYTFYQGDTTAVSAVSYLSAAPGVECVFCAGSADGISSFAPNGANCVYIGNDSLGTTFRNMFEEGKLIFDIAKYNSYIGPAFAILLKSIYQGEAVRVDGKPVSIEQASLQITSAKDYDIIESIETSEGGYFYSAELLSAYILETDLGTNNSGFERIGNEEFVRLASMENTLEAGGLYEVTAQIKEVFQSGNHDIFQFAAGNH